MLTYTNYDTAYSAAQRAALATSTHAAVETHPLSYVEDRPVYAVALYSRHSGAFLGWY